MNSLKLLLLAGLLVISAVIRADAIGTAFTYQGELVHLGQVADGTFDFQFDLYAVRDEGSALTSPIQLEEVTVSNGIFSVSLDFGLSPFTGQSLWLQIGVRPDTGDVDYTLLAPRQNLTATPYAVHASTVSEGSITAASIAEGNVGSTQIADFGITSIDIANSAITQAKLANNSVGSPQVIDGSLTETDVDTTRLQRRIFGNCEPGTHLLGINEDGSVLCTDLVVPASISYLPAIQPYCGDALEILVPDDGLPVILFAECEKENDGPREMVLIKCNDPGCQGGDENFINLNREFEDVVFRVLKSHLKKGMNGHPVVFFEGNSYGDGGINGGLQLLSCADAVCSSWVTNTVRYRDSETPNLPPIDPGYPGYEEFAEYADVGMDVGPDGFPIFVGYSDDYPTGYIDVVKCNDAICDVDWENLSSFEDGASLHFQPCSENFIKVGSDGIPVVLEDCDDLRLTRCNDAACAGEDETPHYLSNTTGFVEYILGPDNVPLITVIAGGLGLIKCNDLFCADDDEIINIVDPDYINGTYAGSSMAIAADDFPVFAYSKSGDLWVAKCNDAACFGGNEQLTLIDGSINLLGSPQITIAANGNPIILYRDFSTGSAKVAHCSTPSCP